MLGAVVLEHPPQVAHVRDRPQVAEEDRDPDRFSTSTNRIELPSWSFQKLATVTGQDEEEADRERRARGRPRSPRCAAEISSSGSSSCAFAEMPSAFIPIVSDSTSATTPRTIGSR